MKPDTPNSPASLCLEMGHPTEGDLERREEITATEGGPMPQSGRRLHSTVQMQAETGRVYIPPVVM